MFTITTGLQCFELKVKIKISGKKNSIIVKYVYIHVCIRNQHFSSSFIDSSLNKILMKTGFKMFRIYYPLSAIRYPLPFCNCNSVFARSQTTKYAFNTATNPDSSHNPHHLHRLQCSTLTSEFPLHVPNY